MLFNSYVFIFIFLPLTLLGYYLLNHVGHYTLSKVFLSLMSLWFYAYFNIYYLWIIVFSIGLNYLISLLIAKYEKTHSSLNQKARVVFLLLGLLLNLGLFFYFKYLDFFIENVNLFIGSHLRVQNILLPLGISFFTFQQLGYIIDRTRGTTEHLSLIDYVCFVTFFPQLIAGPIVLHSELVPQFNDLTKKRVNTDNLSRGIILFTLGLGKKVLLADQLAIPVNSGFANAPLLDTTSTILMILAYTFQIYFDFSGYSDMAIGLGLMFNIKLPINFNSPYQAASVKELWQRWHITLSRFFIQYVYIPLGGSRRGRVRTLINTFIVFFLSGIWHGANWTYIAWGTLQGLLVVWDNIGLIGVKGSNDKIKARFEMPRPLGWFLTFGFFNLSLIFFGSDSISTSITLFKDLLMFKNTGYIYKLASTVKIPELYLLTKVVDMKFPTYNNILYLILFLLLLLISALFIKGRNAYTIAMESKLTKKTIFITALILAWCIISFSQVSTFIYFNF